MKYLMIIEKSSTGYAAYLPDLPGCITTGKTVDEVKKNMQEALELHLEGMEEDGQPVPQPLSQPDYVVVNV
jgi:predicted RNase H-like HicB family nuclease